MEDEYFPQLGYFVRSRDPETLRTQLDSFCRDRILLEHLARADVATVDLPYIPHLNRTLTLDELLLVRSLFLRLRTWCGYGGHPSLRLEGGRLNPTIICPRCFSRFCYGQAIRYYT